MIFSEIVFSYKAVKTRLWIGWHCSVAGLLCRQNLSGGLLKTLQIHCVNTRWFRMKLWSSQEVPTLKSALQCC